MVGENLFFANFFCKLLDFSPRKEKYFAFHQGNSSGKGAENFSFVDSIEIARTIKQWM
jgi:hypothetical protein